MENLNNQVTTKEAARILGVSDGRVRQLILDGQLRARRFGRALTLSRSDVETLRGRKAGRPRNGTRARIGGKKNVPRARAKSLDEIFAESNVTPWTDADFERAAQLGAGLFDGFAEQVRKWRDQNEIAEAERWARLGL